MTKTEHAKQIIKKSIESGGGRISASAIRERVPYSWSTLRRAAEQMGVQHVREGFGPDGSWFWTLPSSDRAGGQG